MSKLRQKVTITKDEDASIRRQYDIHQERWYFSIADVMAVLTESVDARNYWKALKNRLKTSHNQLVMDCNQLKMQASDGKSYMVDVADADTLLKILQLIAPYNVAAFRSWFEHVDVQHSLHSSPALPSSSALMGAPSKSSDIRSMEISTALEPTVDMYTYNGAIVVLLMLPGIVVEKISVTSSMTTLIIQGSRLQSESTREHTYLYQELPWGTFYKKIMLPTLVDIDTVEAKECHGLITITLPIIHQDKTRFIKIKSL